jgi:hypothetical protein
MLPPETNGALDLATVIRKEKGQWVVYLEATFVDRVRVLRLKAYRTERLAEIAAREVRRVANRPPPTAWG